MDVVGAQPASPRFSASARAPRGPAPAG
jgi:hypothetical protein